MAHFLHYNPSTGTISFWPRLGVSVFDGVVDADGLDITWPESKVYSAVDTNRVTMDAGSDTCDDDATNYLIWSSGTALTLQTTEPTAQEVLVSTITTVAGDITDITDAELIKRSLHISATVGTVWKFTKTIPPVLVWNFNTDSLRVVAVKVDAEGFVYAATFGRADPPAVGTVWKISPAGVLVWSANTEAATRSIDVDVNGNVYVCGVRATKHSVLKLDSDGNFVATYDAALVSNSIQINGTDVFVGQSFGLSFDGVGLIKLDTDLNLVSTYAYGGIIVTALRIDSNGDVVMTADSATDVLKSDTTVATDWTFATGQIDSWSIDLDGSNNVYIGSRGAIIVPAAMVVKLNSAGVKQWGVDIGDDAGIIRAVTYDSDNDHVWVGGEPKETEPIRNGYILDAANGDEIANFVVGSGDIYALDSDTDHIYVGTDIE